MPPEPNGSIYDDLPDIYAAIYRDDVKFIEEFFRKYPEEIDDIETISIREDDEYSLRDYTPLTFACTVGAKLETVKKLVELGANVNQEADHASPLSIVVETDNLDLVKYLHGEKDASPIYDEGYSVLVRAIKLQRDEIVDYFVDKHVALNSPSGPKGITPLLMAVNVERIDYVKKLMDAGAKDGIRDTKGNSPLKFALMYALSDIADLIMSYKRRTPLDYGRDIAEAVDWLLTQKDKVNTGKEYRDKYRLYYLLGKVDKLCEDT